MIHTKILSVICIVIIVLGTATTPVIKAFFSANRSTSRENDITITSTRTIKIGFMLQKCDWMDSFVKLALAQYKTCLREGEKKYNVDFELRILEDNFNSGAIHNGALEHSDFDVLLGPGGYGSWYTSETYREKIRNFVANGGGYYGICGDSTFGGFKPEISEEYEKLIKKLFGIKDVTDMLGIANVRSNITIFEEMIGDPDDFSMIKMFKLLLQLVTSRVPVRFLRTDITIQEIFFDNTVTLMLGNVPLIDTDETGMSEVIDIGIFEGYDAPYPNSIVGGTAIIATAYGAGRVVLSAPHAELTIGNSNAYHVFVRNLLWAANALPE